MQFHHHGMCHWNFGCMQNTRNGTDDDIDHIPAMLMSSSDCCSKTEVQPPILWTWQDSRISVGPVCTFYTHEKFFELFVLKIQLIHSLCKLSCFFLFCRLLYLWGHLASLSLAFFLTLLSPMALFKGRDNKADSRKTMEYFSKRQKRPLMISWRVRHSDIVNESKKREETLTIVISNFLWLIVQFGIWVLITAQLISRHLESQPSFQKLQRQELQALAPYLGWKSSWHLKQRHNLFFPILTVYWYIFWNF